MNQHTNDHKTHDTGQQYNTAESHTIFDNRLPAGSFNGLKWAEYNAVMVRLLSLA